MSDMRRRDVIALLGGAAAAWPLGARARGGPYAADWRALEPGRRPGRTGPPGGVPEGLERLGWIDGRNMRLDPVGAGAIPSSSQRSRTGRTRPRLLFSTGTASLGHCGTRPAPYQSYSRRSPTGGRRLCRSLARPGGNVTGFFQFEYSLSAKWLELLKEIAPGVKRAGVLRETEPPEPASSPPSKPRYPWRGGPDHNQPARPRRDRSGIALSRSIPTAAWS